MIERLRALRVLLVALLLAGGLMVALAPTPADAYYGEIEGYIGFYGGSFSGQGCEGVCLGLRSVCHASLRSSGV